MRTCVCQLVVHRVSIGIQLFMCIHLYVCIYTTFLYIPFIFDQMDFGICNKMGYKIGQNEVLSFVILCDDSPEIFIRNT